MEDKSAAPQARRKLFFGWKIVAAGAVLNALAGGAYWTGFSVYFLPITRDFGVSRAATSLIHGLGRLEGGFEGPLSRRFPSRWPTRVGANIPSVHRAFSDGPCRILSPDKFAYETRFSGEKAPANYVGMDPPMPLDPAGIASSTGVPGRIIEDPPKVRPPLRQAPQTARAAMLDIT